MKKAKLQVKIPVSIFKEGRNFVAYSSVLDLSTSGESCAQVKKRFDEAVEILFEELTSKGTTRQVLRGLGWKEQKDTLQPPALISQELRRYRVPASLSPWSGSNL